MTGPEHYAEAERLLALVDRHTLGGLVRQFARCRSRRRGR